MIIVTLLFKILQHLHIVCVTHLRHTCLHNAFASHKFASHVCVTHLHHTFASNICVKRVCHKFTSHVCVTHLRHTFASQLNGMESKWRETKFYFSALEIQTWANFSFGHLRGSNVARADSPKLLWPLRFPVWPDWAIFKRSRWQIGQQK